RGWWRAWSPLPRATTGPSRKTSERRRFAREGGVADDDHGIAAAGGKLVQIGRADEQCRAVAEGAQHARALRRKRRRDPPVARLVESDANEFGQATRLTHRGGERR